MARSLLSPQRLTSAGLAVTYEAANVDGNMIANDERTVVHVRNGGGAAIIVTVPTTRTVDGLAVPDRTVNIPAGADAFIGPFAAETYNQQSGADIGRVYIDYDDVTSVTVAALQMA